MDLDEFVAEEFITEVAAMLQQRIPYRPLFKPPFKREGYKLGFFLRSFLVSIFFSFHRSGARNCAFSIWIQNITPTLIPTSHLVHTQRQNTKTGPFTYEEPGWIWSHQRGDSRPE